MTEDDKAKDVGTLGRSSSKAHLSMSQYLDRYEEVRQSAIILFLMLSSLVLSSF